MVDAVRGRDVRTETFDSVSMDTIRYDMEAS